MDMCPGDSSGNTVPLTLSSMSLHEAIPVPPAHSTCCSCKYSVQKCMTFFELSVDKPPLMFRYISNS